MRQRIVEEVADSARARWLAATVEAVIVGGEADLTRAIERGAREIPRAHPADRPMVEALIAALVAARALLGGSAYRATLRGLRLEAQRAMAFFDGFEPRLVGGVLEGYASPRGPIELQLFTDSADQVRFRLDERGIAYRELPAARGGGNDERPERIAFVAGDVDVVVWIYRFDALRQATTTPASARANVSKVKALIDPSSG